MSYKKIKRWYVLSKENKSRILILWFVGCWLHLFETVVRNSGFASTENIPSNVLETSFFICGFGLLVFIIGLCGCLSGQESFLFVLLSGIFCSGLLTNLWLKVI
jgi:hypothetical protein